MPVIIRPVMPLLLDAIICHDQYASEPSSDSTANILWVCKSATTGVRRGRMEEGLCSNAVRLTMTGLKASIQVDWVSRQTISVRYVSRVLAVFANLRVKAGNMFVRVRGVVDGGGIRFGHERNS